MKSFMANRSLSFKLALVCWMPVIALIGISAHDILSEYDSWRNARTVEQVLEVAPSLSNLVHQLQKERGHSAGFVGSRGAAFGENLAELRVSTDNRIESLLTSGVVPMGELHTTNFEAPFNRALSDLEQLDEVRGRIDDLTISVPALADYYSAVIAELLDAIENMKLAVDSTTGLRPITAYIALMHAKEQAGLERAMGAVGFGSGRFMLNTYERILSLIAKQDHLLAQFSNHAPPETLILLNKLQNSKTAQRVRGYRDIAKAAPFGSSVSGVSGSDWWAATTDRIDALKEVEERLTETLHAQATAETRDAFHSLLVLTFFLSSLAFGAFMISILVYREIQPPIARIITSMRAWTQEGKAPDLAEADRQDGIGELARTFNDLRHRLEETRALDEERTARERAQTAEVKLLSDLNEWLQSSTSTDELYDMIGTFMTKLLPECSGSLYVFSNSRDVLDGTCAWNGGALHQHIQPDDCWSLRRGRGYSYRSNEIKFACEHTKPHEGGPYSCLPILAHGETVGMMHLTPLGDISEEAFFENYTLAQQAAEQISLAIANSKMRDQLHQQSIRDPLTGLYNRRHFIESLRRCLESSKRAQSPFVLASIDVDHFKRFNDNHGHDAGDMVLRSVGSTLEQECDGDELACRIGGEEFMLLLPGADLARGKWLTERLRQAIEKISVRYGEKTLPKITISIGLSLYPDHGVIPQDLMKMADDALYKSKANGRNQITVASFDDAVGEPLTVDFDKVKQELGEHPGQKTANK
ncbi:nitrate- and nitrite sensing domain-containing protein [Roseibium sp.]|uniref:nitrate- and nitrite sensing domain-containing protein n=1 Tax=Roseibium sp. TaxID=1936156 RepID=UPI003B501213